MAHHAYMYAGETDAGIASALVFAAKELLLSGSNNPDVIVLRHGLFAVKDARKVTEFANSSAVAGGQKVIIVSLTRVFHEAQNALLKICEEPPEGTTLIFIVPKVGMMLPTLMSRLLPLPEVEPVTGSKKNSGTEFLAADTKEREAMVERIVNHLKRDSDEDKQAARAEALALVEGLLETLHKKQRVLSMSEEERLLLSELSRFLPILHERAAPIKLILEHLRIVVPGSNSK